MDKNNGKVNIHERITRIETVLYDIQYNHLPHLQKEVADVKKALWWMITLLIGTLIGVIVNLIK